MSKNICVLSSQTTFNFLSQTNSRYVQNVLFLNVFNSTSYYFTLHSHLNVDSTIIPVLNKGSTERHRKHGCFVSTYENLSNRMLLNLCSWKDNVVFPMQNSKGRGWYLRTCKSKIKMYLLVLLGLWVDKKWVVLPLSMNCLSKSLFSLFHSLFFTNSPSEKWVYFH